MKFAWLIPILFALSACDYGIQKNAPADDNVDLGALETLSFAQVDQEVLQPKCVSCHDGSKHSDLRSYKPVFINRQDIYTHVFTMHDMPPKSKPALTSRESAILQAWLRAGALEFGGNSGGDAPTPTTEPGHAIVWQDINEQIIQPKCLSCHHAGNDGNLSDYSGYKAVKSAIGSFYFSTVIGNSMPPWPEGADPHQPNPVGLTHDQKMLISQWIVDGYQEK